MTTPKFSPAEPIAIIGSACRFPGESTSPSKLWSLISNPRDVISDLASMRFDPSGFYHKSGEHHGAMNVSQSYLLSEDPRLFDASFFSINAREAESLDPQQRILLETVYEGLESAGLTIKNLQGSQTAVYVGLMSGDYSDIQMRDTETLPRYAATGTARSLMSNRISYFFDWKGPSMTIDTACSSSLVAVHQAVEILRSGRVDMAVAAGANLIFGPEAYISESKLNMLSPSGRSRMWDTSADGYGRGEGFATVMMKTLSAAIRDGDHIECIIRETGVNQDGRTTGITMPSAISQTQLITDTYARAGLDCKKKEDRCQYFEAHGTGTPAGDPIEAQAINSAFFRSDKSEDDVNDNPDVLYVGSIKTTIGHTEGTAGLAGLLKASLALQHQTIPPNMHLQELSTRVAPFTTHLVVPTASLDWPTVSVDSPRRASVNSFGFGGTNAHAILESYENADYNRPKENNTAENAVGLVPFVFSSTTDKCLVGQVKSYLEFLDKNPDTDLLDFAWNLHSRREALSFKKSFSGSNIESLKSSMRASLEIFETSPESSFGSRLVRNISPGTPSKILGIFTGQGAQWAKMGTDLLRSSQVFSESIENLENALYMLHDRPEWSLREQLELPVETSRIGEAALSQPLCTAIQVALVDLLRSVGVSFHTVIGHSSGEIAAAYAAGLICSEDAIRIAYYRGLHTALATGQTNQQGCMMAAGISFHKGQEICNQPRFAGRVVVAASNAPSSVTLSGDADAINEIKNLLEEDKIFARLLQVDKAYHSHHMMPCVEPYLRSLRDCKIRPRKSAQAVWVSSVHAGQDMTNSASAAEFKSLEDMYWVDNLTNPVLLSQAIQEAINSSGPFDIAIEVGPHSALKGPVLQTIKGLAGDSIPYGSFLRRGYNDTDAFSECLGLLWQELGSSALNLDAFTRSLIAQDNVKPRILKNLPTYSWDHSDNQSYWRESRLSKTFRNRTAPIHELLGVRSFHDIEAHELRWRNILKLDEIPWLRGHCFQGQVLFPGAGYVVLALEAAKALSNGRSIKLIELEDLEIMKAVTIEENGQGVEIIFSLNIIDHPDDSAGITYADFTCYSCHDERKGTIDKCASGRIHIFYGTPSEDILPGRVTEEVLASKVPITADKFYGSMSNIGLEYSGIFRTLNDISRRDLKATASTSKTQGAGLTVHPALLDVCFQSIIAALCFPGDGTLWAPYLPVRIDRLRINPMLCERATSKLDIKAQITESSSKTMRGDMEAFGPDGKLEIQLEGLACASFSKPTADSDRLLFSETCWNVDISTGLAANLEMYQADDVEELELVEACERASYYYLRTLREKFSPSETVTFEWWYQCLFRFADYILPLVAEGKIPNLRKEWANDTEDVIDAMAERYPGQIDIKLIRAVGKALPSFVTGTVPVLPVMLEDDMLGTLYRDGLGAPQANTSVERVVKQITHRYPTMRILEIGAGTGGTTKGVLQALDGNCSYTFTDISTGFFEMAKQSLGDLADDRVVFKPLDIEKDPIAQGYAEGSFDMIIAANVLHATRTMSVTLSNVRKLLRPGGYLILNEVTGDLLRTKLIMSALPGWWLGEADGRPHGPTLSPARWDTILKEGGFSGVDHIKQDLNDPTKQTLSVIVSQAVDEMVEFIREPLENSFMIPEVEDLYIIGGDSTRTATLLEGVRQSLDMWNDQAIYLKSLESLELQSINPGFSLLCMTEIDQPLLKQLSSQQLKSLALIFSRARNVLWVTSTTAHDGSYAMATVGLARTMLMEYPQLNLQVLDVGDYQVADSTTIVNTFLRLVSVETLDSRYLWTNEPELMLEGKKLMIPRLISNKPLNNQLNSTRRPISELISSKDQPIELAFTAEHQFIVQKAKPVSKMTKPRFNLTVHVKFSLPFSLNICSTSYLFICYGTTIGTGEQVVVLSESNRSVVQVQEDWTHKVHDMNPRDEKRFLRCISEHILAQTLLSGIYPGDAILLHKPEAQLASVILRQGSEMGVRAFFTTDQADEAMGVGSPYIFVHELDSVQKIKSRLPRGITRFVDCSDSTNTATEKAVISHIAKSLPEACSTKNLASKFGSSSRVESNKIIQQAKTILHKACSQSYTAFKMSQDAQNITLTDEDLSAVVRTKGNVYIIDWEAKDQVQIRLTPLPKDMLFSPEKTYILFGLSGELGRSLAEWMVACGVKYLILTSRNPAVEDAWIKELSKDGAVIKVFANDITNRQAIKELRDEIVKTMPPVGGVANGAMVLSDALFENMDLSTWETAIKPKINGSVYLDELFPARDLEFFVLFSSAASTVGNAGQSNYSAGCMFMAGLAEDRRKRGLAASVIQIGLIVGIGYVARTESAYKSLIANAFNPISEPLFHEMFAAAILNGRPDSGCQTLIMTGLQRGALPALWSGNPRFSHMIQQNNTSNVVSHEVAASIPTKTQLESTTSFEEAVSVLMECFRTKLALVLQAALENIHPNVPLIDLGIDSLIAVDIRTWFLKEVNVDVPVLKVLGGESITEICQEVVGKLTWPLPWNSSSQTSAESDEASSRSGENSTIGESSTDTADTPPEEADDLSHNKNSDTSLHRLGDMSYPQARMFLATSILEDPSTYNVAFNWKIEGDIVISRFEEAIRAVAQKHESLRTQYYAHETTGQPTQHVLKDSKLSFEVKQVKDQEAMVEEFEILRRHEFDIEEGATIRALVITTPQSRNLMLCYHHIIMDQISLNIVIRDIEKAYTSGPASIGHARQYLDFTIAQKQSVENGALQSDIDFWKIQYPTAPPSLPLFPFSLVKNRKQLTRYDTFTLGAWLEDDLTARIKKISTELKSTPFHFYSATLQILLFQVLDSKISDLSIGVADGNRLNPNYIDTVGFFVNMFPVRALLHPQQTFAETITKARTDIWAGLAHSTIPFDVLVDSLAIPREATNNPLFQVLLSYTPGLRKESTLGDAKLEMVDIADARGAWDLNISVTETVGEKAAFSFSAQNYMYREEDIKGMMVQYTELLEKFSRNPRSFIN